MAGESQQSDENISGGLDLPGKEFILPDISSPWLMQQFVVNHNVSDQMEQESYPTAILDDSCVAEAMTKPSIPLVESVEAFALGLIETPFGSSSKPNVDVPIIKCENHDLQPSSKPNIDVPIIKCENHDLQPSNKPNIDVPVIKCENHDLQPSRAKNAESFMNSSLKEERSHVSHRGFPGSDPSQNVHCDDNGHSELPQPCLTKEEFPVHAGVSSPSVMPISSVNLHETAKMGKESEIACSVNNLHRE